MYLDSSQSTLEQFQSYDIPSSCDLSEDQVYGLLQHGVLVPVNHYDSLTGKTEISYLLADEYVNHWFVCRFKEFSID